MNDIPGSHESLYRKTVRCAAEYSVRIPAVIEPPMNTLTLTSEDAVRAEVDSDEAR